MFWSPHSKIESYREITGKRELDRSYSFENLVKLFPSFLLLHLFSDEKFSDR